MARIPSTICESPPCTSDMATVSAVPTRLPTKGTISKNIPLFWFVADVSKTFQGFVITSFVEHSTPLVSKSAA